jgi:hypothetical protein
MGTALRIKVEIVGGVSVGEACEQVCKLAERLRAGVEANFNGVELWAIPGDDPKVLHRHWEFALKHNEPFAMGH